METLCAIAISGFIAFLCMQLAWNGMDFFIRTQTRGVQLSSMQELERALRAELARVQPAFWANPAELAHETATGCVFSWYDGQRETDLSIEIQDTSVMLKTAEGKRSWKIKDAAQLSLLSDATGCPQGLLLRQSPDNREIRIALGAFPLRGE